MKNIPNATIVQTAVYRITPNPGFVLHHKSKDFEDENGNIKLGYARGTVSVAPSYDFELTTTIDGYTAYGDKEIFARPESEVPENQKFGGDVKPKPEVM